MTLARLNNGFVPSVFDNFFDDTKWFDAPTRSVGPAVNIKEDANEYTIELAAPGMAKDAFKISIDNDRLSISSEMKNEARSEDESYTRREFSYSAFQRNFVLPENAVDQDQIGARYEDGILYISLPKREEVKPKPARSISIS